MKYLHIIISFLLLTIGMSSTMPAKYHFLVGSYTKKSKESVSYCTYDALSNEFKILSHSDYIEDPSFIALNQKNTKVYAVSETDGGSIVGLNFNKNTAKFEIIDTVSSGGAHPCHVMLDKTEKWLFAGNYTGGSLAVIKVSTNGKIAEPHQIIQHTGTGPDKARQEKAHIHSVNISPDNKNLFVADLGTDELVNYAFDSKKGTLKRLESFKASPGSGPRHFTFHATLPYAYLIQEMTGKVTAFKYANGKLKFIEEVSSLPIDFKGKNSSADIHISPDGQFLYASNRFYDTIVRFKINNVNGKLTQLEQTPVNGKTPRNFGITPDGKYMLVANQDSDNISVFRLEKGKMVSLEQSLKISMPICIKFLN